MKRKYIQPNTETVNVKLFGSVLQDIGGDVYQASNHAMEIGARQQSNIFEEDEEVGMNSMWATQKSVFEK